MFDRNNPSLMDVLEVDDSLPMEPSARRYWLVNLRHPLRMTVLHVTRMIASAVLIIAYFIKRLLPFQFSAHRFLQGMICWFMKWFVTPEANYLILRHFWVESNLINFVIANSRNRDVKPVELYPNRIRDLMTHTFIDHDVALFNSFYDLGSTEGELWPVPKDKIDFSLMRDIVLEYDITRRKWTEFCDFETAQELFKTSFCLLVKADEYERSINSFQFDQSLAIRISRILGDPEIAHLSANTYPLSLVGPIRLTQRFVLHGLCMEHLHAYVECVRVKTSRATAPVS